MNRRTGVIAFALASSLALIGCSTLHGPSSPPVGSNTSDWSGLEQALRVEMDSALWRENGSASLVQGALRFDGPQQLFGYHARYALNRNVAITPMEPGAELAPGTALGQETIGHGLGARLPLFFSATPLRIDLEDQYLGQVTPQGTVPSESRLAKLSWAPSKLWFGLNWNQTGAVLTHTLVCNLDSVMRLPLTEQGARKPQTLEVSARECAVVAPDRGFAELPVNAWSAAWSRQGRANLSSLQVTMLEPEVIDGLASDAALPPAYELHLSHARPIGAYQAMAVVRLRHLGEATALDPRTQWSAETRVTRQLRQMSLSASVSHAPDPLWFLVADGLDMHRNQVGLGLGFKRWIADTLATPQADMGLSLNWTEPLLLAQSPEGSVHWNFSLKW